jgi:hypothetical protein
MTTFELIVIYVNECIDDRSMGFTTDFGIGKMVSTHVFYYRNEMIVTIRSTKETKGFSINCPNTIIDWIYSKIN